MNCSFVHLYQLLAVENERMNNVWIGEVYLVKYADCLDAEIECMTNPSGNGYHGTVTNAASGRPCMKWADVKNYTISASLAVDDIREVKNYCRRVPFTEWNGPSCVTVDEAEMVRLERCDVPYCGTTFYIYFRHK